MTSRMPPVAPGLTPQELPRASRLQLQRFLHLGQALRQVQNQIGDHLVPLPVFSLY
jgi:hypothetical protein